MQLTMEGHVLTASATPSFCEEVCNITASGNFTSSNNNNNQLITATFRVVLANLVTQILLVILSCATFWALNQVSVMTEKLRRVPMPSIRGANSHPLESIKSSDRRSQAYSFVDDKQTKTNEEEDIMENVEFDGEVVYTTPKENQKKKTKDKRSVELVIQEETKGRMSESDEDDRVRIV